jgi:hypothetical protein
MCYNNDIILYVKYKWTKRENMENRELNEKTIKNAVSAYLLLFVSIFFLFNKNNKYINNHFVKSHVKTAFTLHLCFLITIIIFSFNSLFSSILIYGISLWDILSKSILIFILLLIFVGIYRANNRKTFYFSYEQENNNYFNLSSDNLEDNLKEKDKLELVFSAIPFLWFLISGKYKNVFKYENLTKLNIILTLIIFLCYLNWNNNLANLISLAYIIYIVFLSINIFTRNLIVAPNLEKIPNIRTINLYLASLFEYLWNYFSKKDFIWFSEILKNKKNNNIELKKKNLTELKEQKDLKIWNFLVYIPIINLSFIFIKNKSKLKFHIENWITISFLIIFFGILWYFGNINSNYISLFLIPILFWYSNIKYDLAYKMPFIHNIYEIFIKTVSIFKIWKDKIKEKRKTNKVSLKVNK